ncbi:Meiotic recombination-like protein [Cardamine amara subsp. amara]|uniref:Meiotic recombination-like protein n=1 Tax=Cardamine amara subsp. amara TaxID=228776 RepID=A0ABD1A840_CARAN
MTFPGGNRFYRRTHHREDDHCIVHYRLVIPVAEAVDDGNGFVEEDNEEHDHQEQDQDDQQEDGYESDASVDDIAEDPDYVPSGSEAEDDTDLVEEIQNSKATKKINFGYMTGSDALLKTKQVVRITTGCQTLDDLLGGGIDETSAIT